MIVECLRCGQARHMSPARHDHAECSRCGYLGWARAESLSERERRLLRDRPVERRRLRIA